MKNAVMAMLEENAQRFPDKIALADEFRQMSYREYLTAAVLVARAITPQLCAQAALRAGVPADGVDPQAVRCNPVGVLIDRNVLSVASFMGIAYTGNFYVPLDPELPAVRMSTILQELSPLLLIDARETPGPLPVPVDVPVLDVRTMFPVPGEISEENSGKAEESSAEDLEAFLQEARELRGMIVDTDPLYAVFTSGSTGVPKGVLVSHRSLFDLTDAFEEVFGFEEDTVFGNQAPFDYDGSSKDLYNALHCGGRVEIIPHRMFMLPAVLLEYLAVRSVNTIIWAVSAVRIVADFRALDAVKTSVPLCLRKVMFSGEVMPVKTINYWMQFFPDALYVNLYGPTEITCNCTYYTITRRFEPDEKFPIGRAFPNTRVFLLEKKESDNEEAGAGGVPAQSGNRVCGIIPDSLPDVRGEICVEGTCVALGYWNNPDRTAENFTAKPGASVTLNRIYRTGDLGYYNKEGELCFASREDNQIKHMSHRIELGEIEAALNAIDFIDVACCFYDHDRHKIVCVYQAGEDRRRQIATALVDRLPKYMRPNKYIRMEQMPLNAHVKIDRRLLRTMYEEGKLK